MGAKIKDYYRELNISFWSKTIHMICGIVVKRDGRNSFVLTKNKHIIQTIIPDHNIVGDTVYLLIINEVTKVITPDNYRNALEMMKKLDEIEKIEKIEGGIITKKICKKERLDISW